MQTFPREKCNFKFGQSGGWHQLFRFYKETQREESVGKPISNGTILLYGKFEQIYITATPQESLLNKDSSPFNPNWRWAKGDTSKISGKVTFDDGKTWYTLISQKSDSTTISYWVSDKDGNLCGNTLSYVKSENDFTTAYGMPNVFQDSPLKFGETTMAKPNILSISIAVKEIVGAVANIQTNVLINSKSVFTKVDTVDLFNGDFSVAGVKFTTIRSENQNIIKSEEIPSDISKWLHLELKIDQRY